MATKPPTSSVLCSFPTTLMRGDWWWLHKKKWPHFSPRCWNQSKYGWCDRLATIFHFIIPAFSSISKCHFPEAAVVSYSQHLIFSTKWGPQAVQVGPERTMPPRSWLIHPWASLAEAQSRAIHPSKWCRRRNLFLPWEMVSVVAGLLWSRSSHWMSFFAWGKCQN